MFNLSNTLLIFFILKVTLPLIQIHMSESSDDNHGSRSNLLIVTPFQIFCMQNRNTATKLHPQLKGTAITSLLGKMWRSLDAKEKLKFEELSKSIRKEQTNDLFQPKTTLNHSTKKKHSLMLESEIYTPLESIELPCPPKIIIRSSSNFGQIASKISKDAIVELV